MPVRIRADELKVGDVFMFPATQVAKWKVHACVKRGGRVSTRISPIGDDAPDGHFSFRDSNVVIIIDRAAPMCPFKETGNG
jgi:hypothetical protein